MKPWMSDSDIKLIESEILKLGKSHLSILEWGSGGSTEHFSKFMTKHNITYEWISIEYNRVWCEKVRCLNIPDVEIVLFDVGNTALKQRKIDMNEYVDYPLWLDKRFDLVIVDGRKRRRCLVNASKIVETDGIVLLHDAERKYYHCAFDEFKSHSFLSKTLWLGKPKDLISVVMPAHRVGNHTAYFKKAIEGIINQTYSNWELLIICDGGLEDNVKQVRSIANKYNDPRIKAYKSKSHAGPGITRNFADRYLSGDYITFHDTDDYSEPERFDTLMAAMDEGGIVASNIIIDESSDGSRNRRVKGYSGGTLKKLIDHSKVTPPIHFSSAIISTKLFRDMGGFEHFAYSSDSIFVIKLGYLREIMNEPAIPVVDKAMFVWRRHTGSITRSAKSKRVLKKCVKSQRKPLVKHFRELVVDKIIGAESNIEEVKEALEIKNNLGDERYEQGLQRINYK